MAVKYTNDSSKDDYSQESLTRLIHRFLHAEDLQALQKILNEAHSADIADSLIPLTDEERDRLFQLLDDETAAEVLDEADPAIQAEIVEEMDLAELADILEAMPPDEAADILGDMEAEEIQSLLSEFQAEESDEVRNLLKYDEETAGGIMTPELVAVLQNESAGNVIEKLRQEAIQDEIFYIYVIDEDKRLLGTVPLRRLVTAPPSQAVSAIMESHIVTISADADQEEAARTAVKYDLLALPVVNEDGRLLGRITVDDLMEVLEEEASEDMLTLAGTGDEELETRSVFGVARVRVPWLLMCLVGCLLSGLVIRFFSGTISQVMALAFFIPAIMAMGGNSGIQTSAIVVRGLGMGSLKTSDIVQLFLREIRVALVMGIGCGIVIGIAAQIITGQWVIGMIVGVSLASAMAVAISGGVIWPMLFQTIGIDPAIAAGPLITTTNDLTGLLIYFLIATACLRFLA